MASVLLVFALASAYLVVILLVSKPLRISKETTYVTGPLKSDGRQIDYFARIEQETYPANMASDTGFQDGRIAPRPIGEPSRYLWPVGHASRQFGERSDAPLPMC